MPITGQNIIDRAADVLQDTTNVRWIPAELIRWLNSGQREIVKLRPDAKYTLAAVTLVQGTKQTLAAGSLRLLDVIRNMGANGTTPGKVIRLISREVLDAQNPDWHTEANAGGVIKHYIYDVRYPLDYYVYPQVPASPVVQVELARSVAPTDLATAASNIDLPDTFEGSLIDYLLFRTYSKDAEYAGDPARAAAYYQMFLAGLGMKTKVDIVVSPNTNMRNVNPNSAADPALNQPGISG